jgi:hypothetical protein
MKESYECEVATHIGPESCGAAREGGVEALTRERAGRVFSRVRQLLRDADAVRRCGRPHPVHRYREVCQSPARSQTPCPTPTITFAVWAASSSPLSYFSLVLIDPCGRGGVREHPRERTRTDGTEPARHPSPEMVQVSAGRDGAVRPPWILRNRRRAALAGALTRSAAAYEVDARSLPPTVVTRPGGSISRGGSAPQ